MVAAAEFLKARPECTGRIGAVGFCWGGGIVNMLATRLPDLAAGVPFYGAPAPTAEVPKIKAALLVQYAENDQGINARRPDFEAALKAAGTRYEMHVYPGTQHGFNNDTTPRYNEAQAKIAWQRTVEFFNTHLRK
jgi:carboxymethylenebutenolidase